MFNSKGTAANNARYKRASICIFSWMFTGCKRAVFSSQAIFVRFRAQSSSCKRRIALQSLIVQSLKQSQLLRLELIFFEWKAQCRLHWQLLLPDNCWCYCYWTGLSGGWFPCHRSPQTLLWSDLFWWWKQSLQRSIEKSFDDAGLNKGLNEID